MFYSLFIGKPSFMDDSLKFLGKKKVLGRRNKELRKWLRAVRNGDERQKWRLMVSVWDGGGGYDTRTAPSSSIPSISLFHISAGGCWSQSGGRNGKGQTSGNVRNGNGQKWTRMGIRNNIHIISKIFFIKKWKLVGVIEKKFFFR